MNRAALSIARPTPSHLVWVFIAAVLLAQLGSLTHTIVHPFHAHTQLCASFDDFDHNGSSPLLSATAVMPTVVTLAISYFWFLLTPRLRKVVHAHIRAPPVLFA